MKSLWQNGKEKSDMLEVKFYDTVDDSLLKFAVIISQSNGKCCMHNVADGDIYRPSSWGAHGMDIEGQDYRACQNYGPLYKK